MAQTARPPNELFRETAEIHSLRTRCANQQSRTNIRSALQAARRATYAHMVY